MRFWRAWLCLFVKVSIPDTGKGKKQGTLSKKYPLYGKSRTDDVMKTPSEQDLSARHLCNPPAIKLPEGVARH